MKTTTKDETAQPDVTFTIDGVEFTSGNRRQTAAALLTLAGVDPAEHYLARVVGNGEVEKPFGSDDVIQLTPGGRFVSIFTGPTPVV